ncbi:MAG: Holliday junction resolvase RuvX [Algoriphagus sp.]|jgi:putative Holliday junction resolvase|uniref:Holliday junction resolvase RuvX n=1 Tax=Algoriphagus sp. TaxID=1872435 RepID=UPI002727262A|nr:Holliday junction resolvase RuvX [Algoriphagus sp.]MDO8965361.1 Holliday junction resolvase RuvX [Algoriphagus sp.]MDP2041226.1 Holliday junction resolvase RuvX [Algoriphagus sp.]MDP3198793.1 Holliday junction resolvase RuvX [Algoriphagus sp.]MDP3472219.1 Holliday junction resolvase RuvX [Algoriphagus sp.]
MPRVLAIDLGTKRTGLAVTDPLKILANPLETIETGQLMNYLKAYCVKEEVEAFVLGLPIRLNGQDNEMTPRVMKLKEELEKVFPEKKIVLVDERFTSKMAMQSMIAMGSKKKDRIEKAGNLDKVSAAIILQSYLERQ